MEGINYIIAFGMWLSMAIFAISKRSASRGAQRLLSQTTKCLAFSEIANGYIAEIYITPKLGNYGNHLYKTLSLIPVVFLGSWFYALQTSGELWLTSALFVSCFWISLTILFEFGFGHYVLGNSWEVLLADYRIWQGRLWLLILLCDAVAPLTMASLINRS